MNELDKDNITKENEQRLSSIGYTGNFPIVCRLASEWIEAHFPGAILKPGYHLWREDLFKIAAQKYPAPANWMEKDENYYNRRNYIIELAIGEIKEKTANDAVKYLK